MRRAGSDVELTALEFNLIELLLRMAGQVVTRERVATAITELLPPSLQIVLSGTHPNGDAVISQLLDVPSEIPLGPIDVLRGYESAMTVIAERTSSELSGISQAVCKGEITREEEEYLTQERYVIDHLKT